MLNEYGRHKNGKKLLTLDKIKVAQYGDYNGFLEELKAGTDRETAILAGAYLEQGLAILLSKFIIQDEEVITNLFDGTFSPLNTFNQKILTAYSLGLVSQQEYHDLKIIKDIRNKFAHELQGITFDNEQIIGW